MPQPSRPKSRPIVEADLPAVAVLLRAGFPERSPQYWDTALARLAERPTPDAYPRFGYVLECAGELVGVILLIFSSPALHFTDGGARARCNVSSWFVQPAFRGFAALLTSAALRFKDVDYLNISPAPNTWPILEVQGYRRYCDGVLVCAPALSRFVRGIRVRRLDSVAALRSEDPMLADRLGESIRPDCVVLRAEHAGDAASFVFAPSRLKGLDRGVLRLAWCAETAAFVRYAGPLGRALLARGYPLVLLDANGPLPGLTGRFFPGRMPKYFKGPHAPRLNDLSHTEALLFGP